jgi:F-type H+-transporting ATPase subunit gamma
MATLRDLRRRIASVKSTQKITKAMELVAAAKMRRAQAAMEASRPYSEGISRVLADLASRRLEATHPFLVQREVRRRALILVTADRGLCGGLNTNAIRAANRFVRAEAAAPQLITIGRKGRDYFRRFSQGAAGRGGGAVELVADRSLLPDRPRIDEILPAVTVATEEYLKGAVDEVWLIYSRYVNAVSQVPTTVRLIPPEIPAPEPRAEAERGPAGEHAVEPLYEFEPSPEAPAALRRGARVPRRAGEPGELPGGPDDGHAGRQRQRQRAHRRPHPGGQQAPPGGHHQGADGDRRRRRGAGPGFLAQPEKTDIRRQRWQ